MDLLEQLDRQPVNLLPGDGIVHYYGVVIDLNSADKFYRQLLKDIQWQPDEAVIFGKRITTRRKVAWYADRPFSYTYSGTTKTARAWTPLLLQLRQIAETESGERYNSCLLNLYHDGSEGMAWHSDAEKDLQRNGAIGSLSFGAARKFSFKHKKTGKTVSKILEHGSLLLMKGETQTHWLHSLPTTRTVSTPRINLTFRKIQDST